jgi:hypothetical protein
MLIMPFWPQMATATTDVDSENVRTIMQFL